MYNSIQHFSTFGIKNLEEATKLFLEKPENMAEFVEAVKNVALEFAKNYIAETLSDCDKILVDSLERKDKWYIVRTDEKQLVTSLGAIRFNKTLFKHKTSGKSVYLLDKQLGLDPHMRLSEDAEANILEEAVQTSYVKAGMSASLTDSVSKQAVKEHIHDLVFPREVYSGQKKEVEYLYIDADEDHVALQGSKDNHNTIVKLVYVYEGIKEETHGGKRYCLVAPHYFSGLYQGKDGKHLWKEVYRYIDEHYDLTKLKKIFLNGDGGAWIKSGVDYLHDCEYVLDQFHLKQCLNRMTTCLGEQVGEAKREILDLLKAGKRKSLKKLVEMMANGTETEAQEENMLKELKYLLNNFDAAYERVNATDDIYPCSAEGHVSHVLSARMSSRPMAWSLQGLDNMAHLRAFHWNKGNMLQLVRAQRKPLETEPDELIFTASQMAAMEHKNHKPYGKYFDAMQCTLSTQLKKKLFLQHHIWGL